MTNGKSKEVYLVLPSTCRGLLTNTFTHTCTHISWGVPVHLFLWMLHYHTWLPLCPCMTFWLANLPLGVCVCMSVCDYAAQCRCRSEHARVTKLWLHVPIPVSVETKNTGTCSSIPPSLPLAHFSQPLWVSWLYACTQTFRNDWFCLPRHLMREKKKWVEFIRL